MKIIHALPRRMRFEAKAASSVELCVAEWVSGSRYRHQTTVFAERGDAPLLDIDVFRLPPARRLASWRLALTIKQQIESHGYDLVVAQQHIPTVARIAAFNPRVPVIIQTHNFIDPPKPGPAGRIANALRTWEMKQLAGITLVSEATLQKFEADWPHVTIPRRVISNGFDFSSWHPAAIRDKTIIVVGRTHQTKGILEAAQGVRLFLETAKDWRAIFILSEPKQYRDYFDSIASTLKPMEHRAEIRVGIPFAVVKSITEKASISIVASKWEEPFGRTALEAHAGGAALISSRTGGLREISGDAAEYLDEITGATIAAKLTHLATNELLRRQLSEAGMRRVRKFFSLTRSAIEGGTENTPICERLDNFYDEVMEKFLMDARSAKSRYRRATL